MRGLYDPQGCIREYRREQERRLIAEAVVTGCKLFAGFFALTALIFWIWS